MTNGEGFFLCKPFFHRNTGRIARKNGAAQGKRAAGSGAEGNPNQRLLCRVSEPKGVILRLSGNLNYDIMKSPRSRESQSLSRWCYTVINRISGIDLILIDIICLPFYNTKAAMQLIKSYYKMYFLLVAEYGVIQNEKTVR